MPRYENDKPTFTCLECGKPCAITEETFDYTGTHCTHSKPGIERTGVYSSDCCDAEFERGK